jgi:hypothetical protein
MEFVNSTRMVAGYNVALERSGRELLVIVVKGTFVLPRANEPVALHPQQQPLRMADAYTGEPGLSAPLHEMDFAPRKGVCDVLLVGHARAPGGEPVTRMRVGMRAGPIDKRFDVVGDRAWQAGLVTVTASAPQPFTEMPVSYDRAFGGTVLSARDGLASVYAANPAGRGWHPEADTSIDGMPLPNTEELGRETAFPGDACAPLALGPIGRVWPQRLRYAGTYDQRWLDETFPFLPSDFDERFHQAAPTDQQMPFPCGPLDVVLQGFTSDGVRAFTLPSFTAPVSVQPRQGAAESHLGVLDTIVFEPDHGRMVLTWRVSRPLRKSIFEIARVRVGLKSVERWHEPAEVA